MAINVKFPFLCNAALVLQRSKHFRIHVCLSQRTILQIKGIWYRYSYFSTLQQETFTDYMIEIKSPVSDDAGQSTTTTEMKVR